MGKRDDLVAEYAKDMQEKCGVTADIDLLTKVVIGLGPAVYNADASKVAGSDQAEIDTVRNNFLIKKLGLADDDSLNAAINSVLEQYGKSNPNKHRAVVYYLLAKHFSKESVYG